MTKIKEEKQNKCPYCEKIVGGSGNLKRHIYGKHFEKLSDKEKEIAKKDLKKRSENITKQNSISYTCPYCDKKVKGAGNLKLHIKSKHPEKDLS